MNILMSLRKTTGIIYGKKTLLLGYNLDWLAGIFMGTFFTQHSPGKKSKAMTNTFLVEKSEVISPLNFLTHSGMTLKVTESLSLKPVLTKDFCFSSLTLFKQIFLLIL